MNPVCKRFANHRRAMALVLMTLLATTGAVSPALAEDSPDVASVIVPFVEKHCTHCGGKNLEIVSRGFRNPWDITLDDGFNWLGTDNDQNEGDRVFMPFWNAHFGWNHPWSSHWTDRPTASDLRSGQRPDV